MLNPFRSEAEAYRFVLITIAAFAAIVIASVVGNGWWGLGVAVLVGTAAALYYLRGRGEQRPALAPRRLSGAGEKRILVVANETVGGEALLETIREKSEGVNAQVLVVAPALVDPVRYFASDEDPARREARRRLDRSLSRLAEAGISARGEVGDSDPLQAIEDALRTFGPDEIVISTHPVGRSNWLEKGVVRGARQRFAVPITHVVVDLAAEREEVL